MSDLKESAEADELMKRNVRMNRSRGTLAGGG